MKEEQSKPKTKKPAAAPKQLRIHVERYQDLLEILDDKRKVWRLAIIVLVTGVALFLGISLLVLQLKKSFTYSDITTNAFGATTIADEQKQVSYFLFNTAELWANSGINVEKGDIISIYSSGAAHTAIHHLCQASADNSKLKQQYFDSNGERMDPESERDKLRSQYRIFPYLPQSALIMQVSQEVPRSERFMFQPDSASQEQFYFIGGKREKIQIRQNGTLFFAVNDIVLDRPTIVQMQTENILRMPDYTVNAAISAVGKQIAPKVEALVTAKTDWETLYAKQNELLFQAIRTKEQKDGYKAYLKDKNNLSFGAYYGDPNTLKTEMDYYYENRYKQAWFDDNVGSFLIVIEKDNANLKAHGKKS